MKKSKYSFIFLAAALFAGVCGNDSFNLLPKHFSLLGIPPATTGFIMSFTGIGGILVLPLLVIFIDRFKGKNIITLALFINILVMLIYFMPVPSPRIYAIPRGVQGALFGAIMTCFIVALSTVVPEGKRSRGFALFGVVGQAGALLAMALGEAVFDWGGLGWLYLFALVLFAFSIAMIRLFPEQPKAQAIPGDNIAAQKDYISRQHMENRGVQEEGAPVETSAASSKDSSTETPAAANSAKIPAEYSAASAAAALAGSQEENTEETSAAAMRNPSPPPEPNQKEPNQNTVFREFITVMGSMQIFSALFWIFLLGSAFGTNLAFLPDLVLERGMSVVRPYYIAYPMTVVVIRLGFSQYFDRLPLKYVLLLPLLTLPASMLVLRLAWSPVMLVMAGFCYGIAHAILFPVLLAFLIDRSPVSFRGRMSIMHPLFFSLGLFVSANVGGLLIKESVQSAYSGMAVVTACGLLLLYYMKFRSTRAAASAEN